MMPARRRPTRWSASQAASMGAPWAPWPSHTRTRTRSPSRPGCPAPAWSSTWTSMQQQLSSRRCAACSWPGQHPLTTLPGSGPPSQESAGPGAARDLTGHPSDWELFSTRICCGHVSNLQKHPCLCRGLHPGVFSRKRSSRFCSAQPVHRGPSQQSGGCLHRARPRRCLWSQFRARAASSRPAGTSCRGCGASATRRARSLSLTRCNAGWGAPASCSATRTLAWSQISSPWQSPWQVCRAPCRSASWRDVVVRCHPGAN